jgi:two-component system chemotaxis response regulator CheB
VEALRSLVAGLPTDLPAAVVVVLHLPAGGTSVLPRILDRAGPLPAVAVTQSTKIENGRVYVAPPNHHLVVLDGELVLSHGPSENGHRPAVNPLFRSAAAAAGPRVIGVILSGVLDDGVAGLVSIVSRGGLAVVQDPADALHPGMPERALQHVQTAHVLPVARMGPLLARLLHEPIDMAAVPAPAPLLTMETDISSSPSGRFGGRSLAPVSGFSCPDCAGTLVAVEPGEDRYRCRVGHAWSIEALLSAQGEALERAMWVALRILDEKVTLATRMCEQARRRGNHMLAQRYEGLAEESLEAAKVLRKHLTSAPLLNATKADA